MKTAQLGQFIESTLKDLYPTQWNTNLNSKPSCLNYRIYKHNLYFEPYLSSLPPHLITVLCKFRCRNFKLPVVMHSFNRQISRDCLLCSNNALGDEFHYLLECTAFASQRKKYFPNYFTKHANTLKFEATMSFTGKKLLSLAKFCKVIVDTLGDLY